MSWFVGILRRVFGGEEDDRGRGDYRTHSSDIGRDYSHHGTLIKTSSSSDSNYSGSVNSISYGSGVRSKSPGKAHSVTQTPLRLPSPLLPPKDNQKSLCLPPQQPSLPKHSSETFLSSNKPKPDFCSFVPPQSASKPLPSSSRPLSSTANATPASLKAQPLPSPPLVHRKESVNPSITEKSTITDHLQTIKSSPVKCSDVTGTRNNLPPSTPKHLYESQGVRSSRPPQSDSKATPVSLKAPPSSRGPHPSTSEPTLSLSSSPVQNGPGLSSSELGPSPSPFNLDKLNPFGFEERPSGEKRWGPQFLPPTTNSLQSSSKQLPFPSELCVSAHNKGSPSPTPCPSDKINLAKKNKLICVPTGTTPSLASDSVSPPPFPNLSPSLNGTSPFSSMPSPSPKNTYFHQDAALIYEIPEDIKKLIKRDIVPEVLKKPLSRWTYKDYFATLLYAEDFYIEKWNGFCLKNATLQLEKASVYSLKDSDKYDEKVFVAFEINLIPERRPFLLSRDFVFLKPAGKNVEPFEGILHQVVKRNRVLAEFGDDFHLFHSPDFKYDVSFSFNRVCLKRSHQAIAAATNLSFENFLFPDQISRTSISTPPFIPSLQNLDCNQISAVQQILRLRGSSPYLIDGPLSRTGLVIQEAVLQIYKNSSACRILVSAPTNKTCDELGKNLHGEILELDIFRANAAFREIEGVPDDILHLCQYEGGCFTCPPLKELQNFKVVFSTFVSSFRLHNEGLPSGHFSHIFVVDASLAMEPEALVVLTNLVDENTNLVVTGSSRNSPRWVRSDIGRRYGLKKSYFQRLMESEPYCSGDSMFVKHL